jgi:hypothetical protein
MERSRDNKPTTKIRNRELFSLGDDLDDEQSAYLLESSVRENKQYDSKTAYLLLFATFFGIAGTWCLNLLPNNRNRPS